MAQQWKVGDVVRLKSGGPSMTVEYLDLETQSVGCVWFHDQEKKTGSFPAEGLEPA